MTESPLLVACLCAQWCGVCGDYRDIFDQVATRFPQMRFVWIDVEDQAELVDPIEVETFPTLLIARGVVPHFFGPLTPHAGTLERIVRERAAVADAALSANGELCVLVARLRGQL